MPAKIAELERDIQTEQGRFEDGRKNVGALERNFHELLQSIHFPEIKADDKVFLNQRTWFPYVHPKDNECPLGLSTTLAQAAKWCSSKFVSHLHCT